MERSLPGCAGEPSGVEVLGYCSVAPCVTLVASFDAACASCWKRHLQKIGIVQYFTPSGLCHEEADKVVLSRSVELEDKEDDDVEGYNEILD